MPPRLSNEKRTAIEDDLKSKNFTHSQIATRNKVSMGTVHNVASGFVKSPEDKPDPTDKRILQLEAQNVALQDENKRCRLAYRAAQRENSIFEALVDEMTTVIKPIRPLPKAIRISKKQKLIRESLVAYLSDEHADQIILPHQVGGLERYNFPIALRRAEEYIDTLIKFTQKTLSNYKFDTLWILAHGDHSSGEIHNAVDHSYYRNQFRNSLAIGQMHALMFRDLAPYFENIKVLYVPGNHGRRSLKKDYYGAWNNWDYLIAETAKMHCSNIDNIEFMIPDAFSIGIEINGWGFHVTHGDEIRSWNNIPWYGIERKTRRLTALTAIKDKRIHYYCFAHFHSFASQSALDGEMIINGPWTATDPYAYEKLSTYTEPSQWIHGVHRERGISWRLNMKLRTSREHLGPNRYVINLAKEM